MSAPEPEESEIEELEPEGPEIEELEATPPGTPPLWASIVAAIVFALFLVHPMFLAISDLVALPELYGILGIADRTPWWLLVTGIAVPPVAYVVALLLARRRPMPTRVLLFGAALGAAYAVQLSLVAIAGVLLG